MRAGLLMPVVALAFLAFRVALGAPLVPRVIPRARRFRVTSRGEHPAENRGDEQRYRSQRSEHDLLGGGQS